MHIGLIIYGRLDNLTGGWLYDRLLVEAGGGVSAVCGANSAREILMDLRKANTVPEDDFYDE